MATRRTFEFGAFRLDPAQRRLEKDGENVALHAKAFDALVYLAEHAGEPVSRRALTEALWPKRVVEENNLTQAISALRRVLGEDCIATLAGRGYQFVAEVRTVDVDPSPAAAVAAERVNSNDGAPSAPTAATDRPSVSARRPLRARYVLLLAASFAVAAILATAVYFYTNREPVRVLVLPFKTLSPDPEQQTFADGLTGELISGLRTLSGLRVMGPTTSFALRGSVQKVPEIAADLDVQFVLEGYVGRDGDLWRISWQLSDADGFDVLGFDRPHESILDIRDAIVTSVATEFGTPLDLDRAPERTDDPMAYYRYLAAVSAEDKSLAFKAIDDALDRDGKFAEALSAKAQMHAELAPSLLLLEERETETVVAETAADKAVEYAPGWGGGYAARAVVRGMRKNWFGAERDHEAARERGFTATSGLPLFLLSAGHFDRARDALERMLEDDPLNPSVAAILMLNHELSGRPAEADGVRARHLQGSPSGLANAAWMWIRMGRGDEIVSVEGLVSPLAPLYMELVDPRADAADRLDRLRRATTEPQYAYPVAQANLAIWAAYFDDPQLAARLLEKALSGQPMLTYVAWLPVFDHVRPMPEFKVLLESLGLPLYWRASGWPDRCHAVGDSDFSCD